MSDSVGGQTGVGSLANGGVLADIRNQDSQCALVALPYSGAGTPIVPWRACDIDSYRFRRTDGVLYILTRGQILRYEDGEALVDVPCSVVAPFDFDGQNHVYFRCVASDHSWLYRDSDLIKSTEDSPKALVGVLADGRLLQDAMESFFVMDSQARQLAEYKPPSADFVNLEFATTVIDSSAFLLGRTVGGNNSGKFISLKFDGVGFSVQYTFSAMRSLSHNYGHWQRFDAQGALYSIEDERVIRYEEGGSATVVLDGPKLGFGVRSLVQRYKAP